MSDELLQIGRAVLELERAEAEVRREVVLGELSWRIKVRPKNSSLKANVYGKTLLEAYQKWREWMGRYL